MSDMQPNSAPMRTVDTLTPADRGTVWRCADCTVAWKDDVIEVATRVGTTRVGAWCRLAYRTWIPLVDPNGLSKMPAGPFYEIENPVFDDFRDHGLANYHSNVQP